MNKEFVNYNSALALKELGFDEPCFGYYLKDKNELNIGFIKEDRIYNDTSNGNSLIGYGKSLIFAPTFSQAFRWFREKHGMHHGIGFNGSWYYDIDSMKNCDEGVYEVAHKWDMETYEEAEQACLDKLIEIVKNNAHI